MALVILSTRQEETILHSPTTEPGRRGWEWRLGSPLPAPIFFVYPAFVINSFASTRGTFTRCSLRNQTCISLVRRTSLIILSFVPSSHSTEARRDSLRHSRSLTC